MAKNNYDAKFKKDKFCIGNCFIIRLKDVMNIYTKENVNSSRKSKLYSNKDLGPNPCTIFI